MLVMKFGGSSLGSHSMREKVIKIIIDSNKSDSHQCVIVSAFAKTTDLLLEMAEKAARGDLSYLELFKKLEEYHIDAVKLLVAGVAGHGVLVNVNKILSHLKEILHGLYLIRELSIRTLDLVFSFGERLSAFIIHEGIKVKGTPCRYLDARDVVVTDDQFGNAKVDFALTNKKIIKYFKPNKSERQAPINPDNFIQTVKGEILTRDVTCHITVTTGFIGATQEGETTTLGRSGSDFSASIFGAALSAVEVVIWTDVDGVMTADPRKVPDAFSIRSMTYQEAMEMSHFGAGVIHPASMAPLVYQEIPLRIRNSFNPKFMGTWIKSQVDIHQSAIKGISSIDKIALVTVQGPGMHGVAGMSARIFGVFAHHKINIILITQASSEHSICIAVRPESAIKAKNFIDQEFALEIKANLIEETKVEDNLSIVAVVGENMRKIPGLAGKLFGALGRNGINIGAIAQGSSELNISLVVSKEDERKALNVIHEKFFLAEKHNGHLFVLGATGRIGRTLLEQIAIQIPYLEKEHGLHIHLVAVANSSSMVFTDSKMDFRNWDNLLHSNGVPISLSEFCNKMRGMNFPNSVFVDCTSSDEVIPYYLSLLNSNISIVTPNKRATSGSYLLYKNLKKISRSKHAQFHYETNVGAGLPVIKTIRELLRSGDHFVKIEGILSGTMSYIFNHFDESTSFYDLVMKAKELGYTEPDPREDLLGLDVRRKLLILIRELGIDMEIDQIPIVPLFGLNLTMEMKASEFWNNIQNGQETIGQKLKECFALKKKLRYIASYDVLHKRATIGLHEISINSPFYHIRESENVISLTTHRYRDIPLIIKGPGAGREVTAAGVLSDVLKVFGLD